MPFPAGSVTRDVTATVKMILSEQLGLWVHEITKESTLADLGADSLDLVEMLLALEDEFTIEIPDEEAEKFRTVGDLIECVKGKAGG